MNTKKVVILLSLLVVVFTSCGIKQSENSPTNQTSQREVKVVHIDSDPEGATVYIDNNEPITTPAVVKLSLGWHYIHFAKNGYEDYIMKNVEVREDTTTISVTLKKIQSSELMFEFGPNGAIIFDSVPIFRCCSAAAITYSGIFYGGTYTISGKTLLNSFDLIFPSGKNVHFDTEKVSDKVRKFSKVVTFNEIGEYKIVSDGTVDYAFIVDYKPTILSPTPKLEDIFKGGYKNAIAVPVGSEVEVKVLITDANGKPIPNTSLGVYGLKTDKDGIVTFNAKVERRDCPYCYTTYINGQEAGLLVYGDLLIFGYDYAKYTMDGKLVSSTTENAKVTVQPALLPSFKGEVKIVREGNDVYMPYDSIGVRLVDIYKGAGVGGDNIFPHPRDPSVIYTNSFVSKDEGKHFEKMIETLDAIALNPENPGEVVGWSRNDPKYILKSDDFGAHFEKFANIDIDLSNDFVEQIAIDPNNLEKFYLATWKGLYVSNDGGKNFLKIPTDFGIVNSIAISPSNHNIVIVGAEKGILKSSDGGKTWRIVKQNSTGDRISCITFGDPTKPKEVFAGSMYEGLLASYDEGETWKSLYKGDLEGKESIAVIPYEDTYIMYISSFRDGIYTSIDKGKTFTKVDFPVGNVTSIAAGSNGFLYIMNDGIPFVQNDSGNILPLDGDTFLVGGPKWKIVDGKLFIDMNDIKSDIYSVKVNSNSIEIFRMCDMVP
jgi:photosystem II stability/assembly factor-like uncharacterized protein